jgi:hypothetical protein
LLPHRQHAAPLTMINLLILFKDIIDVYSENHTKHVNTLFIQNVEFSKLKGGGGYSYHCASVGYNTGKTLDKPVARIAVR